MLKSLAGIALLMASGEAVAASSQTNFGIRTVEGEAALGVEPAGAGAEAAPAAFGRRVDIGAVASLGSRWGRVTSTVRSPAHNRRVGGVRNSFHLSGRAIDIARRPGVSHAQIAAAYRNAGYYLIESLDEGDHSHFAFGTGARGPILRVASAPRSLGTSTRWGMVTVGRATGK